MNNLRIKRRRRIVNLLLLAIWLVLVATTVTMTVTKTKLVNTAASTVLPASYSLFSQTAGNPRALR